MDSQDSLLLLLSDGRLVESLNVDPESSVEGILDARDSENFSSRWMGIFKSIDSQKSKISKVQSERSTKIRELAFLRAYSRWKSSDLATYISDDFGLIADTAALGIDQPWVEDMLGKYKHGEIPSTP